VECGPPVYGIPRERVEAMQWPQATYERQPGGDWEIRLFDGPGQPSVNLGGMENPWWAERAWSRRGAERKARRLLGRYIAARQPVAPAPSGVVHPADL
jgi:hypothetical protein